MAYRVNGIESPNRPLWRPAFEIVFQYAAKHPTATLHELRRAFTDDRNPPRFRQVVNALHERSVKLDRSNFSPVSFQSADGKQVVVTSQWTARSWRRSPNSPRASSAAPTGSNASEPIVRLRCRKGGEDGR